MNREQVILQNKMEETTKKEKEQPEVIETKEEIKERKRTSENIVFIGSKPFMNYVTGVVMQFNTKNAPQVIIKSRGKFISKAVDVEEVARRRFLKDKKIIVKDIKVNSEEFTNKEGKTINVSTMEITLKRE